MGSTQLERYTYSGMKIGNAKLLIELPRIKVANSGGNGKVDERAARDPAAALLLHGQHPEGLVFQVGRRQRDRHGRPDV